MEMPVKNEMRRERVEQDGGVLPTTGFPHVGDKAKEGQCAPTVSDSRRTRVHLIHHTTCIRFAGHRLGGYTFEACKRGWFGFGAK